MFKLVLEKAEEPDIELPTSLGLSKKQEIGKEAAKLSLFVNDMILYIENPNANICWIMEKAREFQKNIYFCFIDYAKAFDKIQHSFMRKTTRKQE